MVEMEKKVETLNTNRKTQREKERERERERETCLEEKMEIGGVRGRKERLVEEELLEVFNGTMT